MFENLEQLRKIRRKALMLASLGKWRIIDAGKPIAEVEMEIAEALQLSLQGTRF
jgi:thymidylate kinase